MSKQTINIIIGVITLGVILAIITLGIAKKPKKVQPGQVPVSEINFAESSKGQTIEKGTFAIQVCSLKKQDKAKEVVEGLIKKGFSAYLLTYQTQDLEVWHRVRIGNFKDMEKAKTVLEEVKKDFADSFLVSGLAE